MENLGNIITDAVSANAAVAVLTNGLGANSAGRLTQQQTLSGKFVDASVEEAVKYREANSIRDIVGEKLKKLSLWGTKPEKLGKYGVGLELYFSFLRYSLFLFFLIALVSVWPIVMNATGGYLLSGETNSSFDILGLANERGVSIYSTDVTEANASITDNQKYQLMTLIADVTYTVFFILFLIFYRIKTIDIVERNLMSNLVPSDFAIEVKGLPKEVTKEQVQVHFSQFGKVEEVSLARNFNGTLMLYAYRTRLSIQLGIAKMVAQQKGQETTAKITVLEKSIKMFDSRINKKQRNTALMSHELPVNRAYVLFNNAEDKFKCLSQYAKARRCCQSRKKQPSTLQLFSQHPLKVKPAPEPSNILWENLEVKSCSRRLRRLIVAICSLALMIMSVALMYWLKSNNTQLPRATDCAAAGVTSVSLALAKVLYTTQSNVSCWCMLQGITNILESSSLQSYCSDYLTYWQKSTYIKVLSSIGIIAINFILKLFLRKINRFQRVSTVTKEQSKLMYKIFLATFINTAFINLVVNANFQEFDAMQYVPFKQYMFAGDYKDFTRDWYLQVGSATVVTMFISMISPHCINLLLWYPIKNCRICCCKKRRKTQYELDQLYLGPDYDIAAKNAIALNIIFSCFLYSGGMPLLNVICFCSLFLIYWVEKYLIINYYRKPPVYDEGVNVRVMAVLPYAILLHCGFSLYMYGSDAIWPENYSVSSSGYVVGDQVSLVARIYRFTGITFILVMICTCFIAVFSIALAGLVRKLKFRKSVQCDTTQKPLLTYMDAMETMKLRGVASYDIRENPYYHDLLVSFDHTAAKNKATASGSIPETKPEAPIPDQEPKINNYMEQSSHASELDVRMARKS